MKDIHPQINDCSFVCATCGSSFEIKTTMKAGEHAIDVCSKCHPFYIGKISNKQLRGKSEKLIAKFETAKSNAATPKKQDKKTREKKQRSVKTLDSL